jgi:ribosomal protein L11 methyltransferase
VLANLLRPLLLTYAARLVDPPAVLVASGLLAAEADEVAAALAGRGMLEAGRRRDGDWVAMRFILNSSVRHADHHR